ncbi:putative lysozyme-like protein [Toxorhynchites rutilus septentrionalis]|uniref:putative lysozyme-like protein n=1 Tax=Toxorhynchites rutilus septentrionalis TaxID=329112 RepID=UPI00247A48A2|nr:putative lysozyme-like protein [Toxorhynchites rutilus septentrionalis]
MSTTTTATITNVETRARNAKIKPDIHKNGPGCGGGVSLISGGGGGGGGSSGAGGGNAISLAHVGIQSLVHHLDQEDMSSSSFSSASRASLDLQQSSSASGGSAAGGGGGGSGGGAGWRITAAAFRPCSSPSRCSSSSSSSTKRRTGSGKRSRKPAEKIDSGISREGEPKSGGTGVEQPGRHRECETISEKESLVGAKDGNGNDHDLVAIGVSHVDDSDDHGGNAADDDVNAAGHTGRHGGDLVAGVSVRVFQWVRGMNFGCRRRDGIVEKR